MRVGLRARGAIAFALLALFVSVGLATLTYEIVRRYLLDQRQALVVRQVGLNARALNASLGTRDSDVAALIGGLPGSSGNYGIARVNGTWFSSSIPVDGQELPADVVAEAARGHAVRKLLSFGGEPSMVVGIPLTAVDGEYFEVAVLSELQRTLSVLGWSLFAGAAFTTAVGALLGLYASRRVLRPLREFSHAAEEVGRGHLQTRLSVGGDPDLAAFCDAFNEMAEALEHRTERDARFASDVSHELRNPLTALTAAVDVLGNRADERSRPAVEIVRSQVVHFQQLVLDLLELSRLDAGQTELRLVEIDPRKYFPSAVNSNEGETEVVVDDSVPRLLSLDQRRVAQILANLLDNANRHGGGVTRVEITAKGSALEIAVEDDGPGVPEHERGLIFDRFRRGSRFGETTRGSGLGLAIVAEHCRAHGGEARMEQRRGGGARFVAVVRVRGRK